MDKKLKIVILGAAGRDFHNFNVAYRDDPDTEVVAFTATQIPFIEDRTYPPQLAGAHYPAGIPIFPESQLEDLIRQHQVDRVVFAYSDVAYADVMHRASRVLALNADFILLGPDRTMLRSRKPVISVCAVRTGCGKSGVSRYISGVLRDAEVRAVVLRHPMPYGNLAAQRCQRFASLDDLDRHSCTLEEREEYELHIRNGAVVYAGVDYGQILRRAEREADVILWDGGNNDLPFLEPNLEIVVLDPHRAGHEMNYYPGEVNLRRADLAVINKVDTAVPEQVEAVAANVRRVNPDARILRLASPISVKMSERIRGKRVLAVEDGPTLTHGGMAFGAAALAAEKFGAAELVDPRPYASGSIQKAFEAYPHLRNVLPALGYSREQLEELRATIERTPCDLILLGTPVDLERLLHLAHPALRVSYGVSECDGSAFRDEIHRFLHGRCRSVGTRGKP